MVNVASITKARRPLCIEQPFPTISAVSPKPGKLPARAMTADRAPAAERVNARASSAGVLWRTLTSDVRAKS